MNNCWVKFAGEDQWTHAEFLGLLEDEHGQLQAVLRVDGSGMALKAVHYSRVRMSDPKES